MKKTFRINPVPASRARVTRWSTYFPKRYTQFKKDMQMALNDVQYVPEEGLLYVKLDFFVSMPMSWSKKKKAAKNGKFCDNNADIDNYCKAILDSLEGIYYANDNQVVMIRARKYYSDEPRIEFEMENIENEND